jgi:hypothetical protein
MTKLDIIHTIEDAEIYHQEQLQKVSRLLGGEKLKNLTPVDKDTCNFGVWLYTDGRLVEKLLGLQLYENMELMHTFWHAEYKKIYEIFYDTKKHRILTFFVGNKRQVSSVMLQKAKVHFLELQEITKNLLKALYVVKKRVLALGDNCFS